MCIIPYFISYCLQPSMQAEGNLARYGRALLDNLPNETTALLIDICTSLTPSAADDDDSSASATRQPSTSGAGYLSYLALSRGSTSAAPSEVVPPSSASTTTTVKANDRTPRREASASVSGSNSPPSMPSRSATPTLSRPTRPATIKRPSPRIYFAHFIDRPTSFLHFLEAVALRRWGQSLDGQGSATPIEPDSAADPVLEKRDQSAVWNTLLELYLSSTGEHATEKAMQLLRRDDLPYDHTHALILCSTRGFTSGLVLLWEKLGMYADVLRFYIDKEREDPSVGASVEVVKCLERYGATQPGLYPLVLRFLTSTPELLSRHTEDLSRILEHIEQEKIMPPLAVVQVLSRNNVASVGLVKQWLLSRIKASREEIHLVCTLLHSAI
jgi:vacuolar protein sorting-associated protein 11